MALRLTAIALLAVPALVLGQTISVNESNTSSVGAINIAECQGNGDRIALSISLPSTTVTTTTLTIKASRQSTCPDVSTNIPVNTTTPLGSVQASASPVTFPVGNNTIDVRAGLIVPLAVACDGTNQVPIIFFCAVDTSTGTANVIASGQITVDTSTPVAPTLGAVQSVDSGLNVNWQLGTGSPDAGTAGSANSFNVYSAPSSPSNTPESLVATGSKTSVTGSGLTSTRINNLVNGTSYDVVVTALTQGLNESAPSALGTGTPEAVNDFWRTYKTVDGGRESGGCSTGGIGLLALAALVPIAIGARRARRRRS